MYLGWFYSHSSWEGKSSLCHSIWTRSRSCQHILCWYSGRVSSGPCTERRQPGGLLDLGSMSTHHHFSEVLPATISLGSYGIPTSLNRKIRHFSKIPGQPSFMFPLASRVLARVLHLVPRERISGRVSSEQEDTPRKRIGLIFFWTCW